MRRATGCELGSDALIAHLERSYTSPDAGPPPAGRRCGPDRGRGDRYAEGCAPPRPARGRRLLAAAAGGARAAPRLAAAAPVGRRRCAPSATRSTARDAALGRRLARRRGRPGRPTARRLDRARARPPRARSAASSGASRGLYVSPDPSPVIEVLTGGDLDDAQARHRPARGPRPQRPRAWWTATAPPRPSCGRRRSRCAAQGPLVAEREAVARRGAPLASGRLATAERRESAHRREGARRPGDPDRRAADSPCPSLGLPAAAPAAGRRGADRIDPRPAGRADRREPRPAGRRAGDAATGAAVDTEPAPAGPGDHPRLPAASAPSGPAAGAPLAGPPADLHRRRRLVRPGLHPRAHGQRRALRPERPSAPPRARCASARCCASRYGGRVVTVRVNDRGPYVRGPRPRAVAGRGGRPRPARRRDGHRPDPARVLTVVARVAADAPRAARRGHQDRLRPQRPRRRSRPGCCSAGRHDRRADVEQRDEPAAPSARCRRRG